MNYPPVILVGGAPLMGKTAVARRLAETLGYACISTDDLIEAIIAVTTAQSHPHLHLLEQKDHRKYFITRSPARLVADADYRNEALWPALKILILKHIETADPAVIEGWHLLPQKAAQLNLDGVASLWLVAGQTLFEQRMRQEADLFCRTSLADELFRKFVERSTLINDRIRRSALALNLPLIEVSLRDDPKELCRRCLEKISKGAARRGPRS